MSVLPDLVVAAAAEQNGTRLIVISDVLWGTDMVARIGPTDVFGRTLYARFPGNPELFVNSVYWLAGLDSLVAPGARTQGGKILIPVEALPDERPEGSSASGVQERFSLHARERRAQGRGRLALGERLPCRQET